MKDKFKELASTLNKIEYQRRDKALNGTAEEYQELEDGWEKQTKEILIDAIQDETLLCFELEEFTDAFWRIFRFRREEELQEEMRRQRR